MPAKWPPHDEKKPPTRSSMGLLTSNRGDGERFKNILPESGGDSLAKADPSTRFCLTDK